MAEPFCDGQVLLAEVICEEGFLFPDGTNSRSFPFESLKWGGIEKCQSEYLSVKLVKTLRISLTRVLAAPDFWPIL